MNKLITSRRPTRLHRWIALSIALGIGLLVAAIYPYASQPLPACAPFVPIFCTAVVVTEAITSLLMWVRFRMGKSPIDAALAAAYAFSSLTCAVQLLIFPGVFAPTGLLGASKQTAVWIWVLWHGGFPTIVLLGFAAQHLASQRFLFRLKHARLLLLVALAGSVAGCVMAVRFSDWLPMLIKDGSYSLLRHSYFALYVVVACVTALAAQLAISGRMRSVLDLWLSIALLAFLADVTLTLAGSARFTLGWYGARVASVIASSALLAALLVEISMLYSRLARINEDLEEKANRDALTGLYNRGWFDAAYTRECLVARHQERPLSVLMVDVDHFKLFNDAYGHAAGDDCLRLVASALTGCLRRQGDAVSRYGGEEFVVLLPGCATATAVSIAEAMRSAVRKLDIPARSPAGRVTISLGVFTCDAGKAKSADPLQGADENLYRAKEAGRDRVVAGTRKTSARGLRARAV
ncbi:GGDEF domain-containing protein [Paraburkholderia sp. Ac-20340]|uniref:sensor domain-containing diguanylate cyclase n=1 Tax=Paraburkholderia sp. Ac-20340 TaxID=2703888 RepID=UPI0019819712|nr:sensor domain-containing diguanylate cyclase [Paraburkholderia sp. Ac-20340]MBN3854954.1 GGDEF domain-containing protein [Paraburkholderia sp. Ac-20340]